MLAVWRRNQDWWLFISGKTTWQFYGLFICQVLHFRSEHQLGNRLATSNKGELKVRVLIVLLRLREVDILLYESSILGQLLIWVHKWVLDGNPYSFKYSNSRTRLCNQISEYGMARTQISEYRFWGKSLKFSKCQNL